MSSLPLNRVVLVRQGGSYDPHYVKLLTDQIKTFNPEASVITLTDQGDTPGRTIPLWHGLKGWWAKLELFAPETRHIRPFLYIDLDSYVLGPVTRYFGGRRFTMTRDFMGCSPANSSVMWVPKGCERIWATFWEEPRRHMQEAGSRGDQYFLGRFAEHLFEDVKSYRVDCLEAPQGSIIQFHGKPKPHECDGWAGDIWNRSRAASTGPQPLQTDGDTPSPHVQPL